MQVVSCTKKQLTVNGPPSSDRPLEVMPLPREEFRSQSAFAGQSRLWRGQSPSVANSDFVGRNDWCLFEDASRSEKTVHAPDQGTIL